MSGTRPSSAASRDIDRMLHSMRFDCWECSTSSGRSRDARRPAWVAGRPVSFCSAVEIVKAFVPCDVARGIFLRLPM